MPGDLQSMLRLKVSMGDEPGSGEVNTEKKVRVSFFPTFSLAIQQSASDRNSEWSGNGIFSATIMFGFVYFLYACEAWNQHLKSLGGKAIFVIQLGCPCLRVSHCISPLAWYDSHDSAVSFRWSAEIRTWLWCLLKIPCYFHKSRGVRLLSSGQILNWEITFCFPKFPGQKQPSMVSYFASFAKLLCDIIEWHWFSTPEVFTS